MTRRHSLFALTVGALLVVAFLMGRVDKTTAAQTPDIKADQLPTRYLYDGKELSEPRSQFELDWLLRRKKDQEEQAKSYEVYHDFKFTDRLSESGITFKHSITDDQKTAYKADHYDHGNGILVADVDGDGLYDIYFINQMGCNELWRNLGGGRFENITEKAGLGLCGQISVSGAFADIDNDGKPDLFVTTVRHGNHLFHNDGGGKFTDITQSAGVAYSGHSSGSRFL